jgi:hypothetical protein
VYLGPQSSQRLPPWRLAYGWLRDAPSEFVPRRHGLFLQPPLELRGCTLDVGFSLQPLSLRSRKSNMENGVRVAPLLCQRSPSETNALADRADAHRNVEPCDSPRHDLHTIARHIVETREPCESPDTNRPASPSIRSSHGHRPSWSIARGHSSPQRLRPEGAASSCLMRTRQANHQRTSPEEALDSEHEDDG